MNKKISKFLIALAMALMPTFALAQIPTGAVLNGKVATSKTTGVDPNGTTWCFAVNADGTTATILAGYTNTTTAFVGGDVTLPETVTATGTTTPSYSVTGIEYYYYLDPSSADGTNDYYTNWRGITTITFPTKLTSIGRSVFCNAAALTAVKFNNPDGWASLEAIGGNAFNVIAREFLLTIDGLDLSHLTDPIIKGSLFRNRGGVTGALKLPIETTAIGVTGNSCPFGGTSITSVNFTELTELTGISTWAFQSCNLTTVDLSNCAFITTIGHNAFDGNPSLTSVKFPNVTTLTIDYQAFQNDNLQGDLEIPSTNTTLGYQAFMNNRSLRSITFTGTTLNMSGYQVFAGCNELEYIDMKPCLNITGINSADVTTLSRATVSKDAGHMFSGLPVHTIVYLPSAFTTFQQAGAGLPPYYGVPNYVINVGAYSLLIEEGQDYFFPHPFYTRHVGYRAYGNNTTDYTTLTPFEFEATKKYSLYLPYPFTLPASMGGYALGYYNQHKPGDTTDNTFVFKKQTTFAANTPYIARIEDGSATATLPDIGEPIPTNPETSVPASPVGINHPSVPGVDTTTGLVEDMWTGPTIELLRPSVKDKATPTPVTWTLCGTSELVDKGTAKGWGAYYFGTDGLWHPVNAYDLKQHRVFFVPSVAGAAPSKGFFEGLLNGGETTGIGNVSNNHATTTHIYNMSGQYVGEDINALPKGVYIVNGKKVVK